MAASPSGDRAGGSVEDEGRRLGAVAENSFARPGDQFIRAGTDQSLVTAHAVRRPDGDLAVLLVNKDPDNARDVAIDYGGFTPADATPTIYSYVNSGTSVTSARTGRATAQMLPPHSLTTIVLHPASKPDGAPAAPAGPPKASIR